MALAEWLAKCKCCEVLQALVDVGAKEPTDLLDLTEADLDLVLAPLKKNPADQAGQIKALAQLRDGGSVRPTSPHPSMVCTITTGAFH